MKIFIRTAVAAALAAAAAGAGASPHWERAPKKTLPAFHPGVASLEWTASREHGGSRGMRKGETCAGCHGDEAAELGKRLLDGHPLEPQAAALKGKAPAIAVSVQAVHDDGILYLRFQWKQPPSSGGAKMDARNAVKLAVMLEAEGKVEYAALGGCWASCHHDLRSMPDADAQSPKHARARELDIRANGPTKYLKESRTALEVKTRPFGGWDKLKPEADYAALLAEGRFLELWQWRSADPPRAGYVLEARRLKEAKEIARGSSEDGVWTVTFRRPLAAAPGRHAIERGKHYTFGFAIHDDHADYRHHHVSFGYRLGLDDPKADVNAVGQ